MERRDYFLSFKGQSNSDVVYLLERCAELDAPGLSCSEIVERAESYIASNATKIDFSAYNCKKTFANATSNAPQSVKIKVNNLLLDEKINLILKEHFHLLKLHTPFKLRMVLLPYLDYLTNKSASIDTDESNKINAIKLRVIDLVMKQRDVDILEKVIDLFE